MWNAAAGVEGTKRGMPSDSRPAFVGCSASTSFRTGSALKIRDSEQVRRQRPQHQDAADVGVGVELGDLADDLAQRGVAGQLLGPRRDAQLVRVAVDAPLVDLRREVVAHEQRGDAGGARRARPAPRAGCPSARGRSPGRRSACSLPSVRERADRRRRHDLDQVPDGIAHEHALRVPGDRSRPHLEAGVAPARGSTPRSRARARRRGRPRCRSASRRRRGGSASPRARPR